MNAHARWPVWLLLVGAVVLAGCSAGRANLQSQHFDYGTAAVLPPDLPENPEPCMKYCKKWVEPTYRMVPKLVQCGCATERVIEETVMETRAREVCVKPRRCDTYERCGQTCDQELVQIKPGGFRWVGNAGCDCKGGDCWQYCEQCPEYKWCNKRVEENGIRYCVEQPPEYKTVVETVPVKRKRVEFVPPKYEIKYVRELYQPGHHEWVGTCDPSCSLDRRKWSKPFKGTALTCDCPTTN